MTAPKSNDDKGDVYLEPEEYVVASDPRQSIAANTAILALLLSL
jgi:hypothetical protein